MQQQLCGLPDIEEFAFKKNTRSSSKFHFVIKFSFFHIPHHSVNLISVTGLKKT